MLVMLLQSLMGVSDKEIIDDYFKSNQELVVQTPQSSSKDKDQSASSAAAVNTMTTFRNRSNNRSRSNNNNNNNNQYPNPMVKLDRTKFSGTNREAMMTTLAFLRTKYRSIVPGYMDDIGFDASWRRRLRDALAWSTTAATAARPPPPTTGTTIQQDDETVPYPKSRL
jgi:hypothetical protein